MFTTEQKKFIIALQSSEKEIGKLIGQNDSENHLNRSVLGVYAHCCGIPKSKDGKVLFENNNDGPSRLYSFSDYKKYFLASDSGLLKCFSIYFESNKDVHIFSLLDMNSITYYDFPHKFISKFLFTMPERVFTNFPKLDFKSMECKNFVRYVEDLSDIQGYDHITKRWKEEFGIGI
jgi:hypothetical protein